MNNFKKGNRVFLLNKHSKKAATVLDVLIKPGKPLMLKLQFKNNIANMCTDHIYKDFNTESVKGDTVIFNNNNNLYLAKVIKNYQKTLSVQTVLLKRVYTIKKTKSVLIKFGELHKLQLLF